MSDIKGPPADMTFTLTVTRKDTGKVEHYQMEGHILSETPVETPKSTEGETPCQQP